MFVIAGVSGHVGGVAAQELLAKGQKVKVIVRDPAKGTAWSGRGAEVAVGRLDDVGFLTGALKGATGFFTLLPPDLSAPDFYAAQCKTADAIVAAVKAAGTPHVAILSSFGADLAEGTGPIKGLYYLETHLRPVTKLSAIRAASFMENLGMVLAPAKGMGMFPNFAPSQDYPIPMIATKDIGMLVAKTLMSPPARSENVDLVGPSYSAKQQAEKLGAALGKQLNIMDIPQAGWVGAMMQGGLPKHLAEVYAEMYGAAAAGKLAPRGDRLENGSTTLDEVVKTLV
jgi:uncharacterized protein YbjT (DUF2867 family)